MRRVAILFFLTAVIMVFGISPSYSQLTKLVVSLTGSVFNEITHQPINVRMEAFDANGKRVYRGTSNAEQNGYYYITGLKPGEKYFIRFGDVDYFKQDFEVDIPPSDKYEEFSRDFLIKPKAKGLRIPLKVPTFELGKMKLRAGSEFFLKDILETMQKNPRVRFQILSFPDNDMNPNENKVITEGRCNSLRDYFIKNGIEADRILVYGSDQTDPTQPPPTKKMAKGKRYVGPTYFVVESF
jgi:outer membrane protein OmpA-like peptidoglycan-associated protein